MTSLPRLFSAFVAAFCLFGVGLQATDAEEVAGAMPSCCKPINRFSSIAKSAQVGEEDEVVKPESKLSVSKASEKDTKSIPEPAISLIGGLALTALLIRRRGTNR